MDEQPKGDDTVIMLPLSRLADLLREAATEGIRVGEAGTRGDHTESGIAGKILMRNKIIPLVDLT